ncbi:hypothetical protein P152DRAFT_431102 [Eremomyces bilateralis CBS 781.70]|uniref:Ams2/SPT21 N-terminal domain-containing protein n=1 Tax=Eremomyces bilateralis CBS 781.70 TaxID=1392243 RepID=A0A6G1GA53_9PEZI|nr:uncharacterized protein P152DRAFT_431102 [Eremomyces bilateralis CBS 781.70]KAF1814958.1 hypothetical protein P152DRAFT_431102 [Eremomyces bilateralis CBS 781.70]
MSSPSLPSDGATPRSDLTAHGGNDMDSAGLDIPRRLMKVKVLYTFDDQNKTNCLARLPNAVNVPVVDLDDSTQIGVIELRTCIQAIITASPELISKLEHDYTVYAYDFSEYDTPLVGQGLLSAVLTSGSTPNAPLSDSQPMITGRVCRNILGIFSGGASETLEVKLRLVPVPSSSQTEYMANMERYRSMNRPMPDGYENAAWTNYPREYQDDGRLTGHSGSPPAQPQMQRGSLQRSYSMASDSLHDILAPRARAADFSDAGMTPAYSIEGSRVGSPTPSVRSANGLSQGPQQYPQPTRPPSRASVRGDMTNQQMSDWGEGDIEEGPAKKRARLEQVEWRGKTAFGAKQDSLRVAASTQASIRGHRPLPGHLMAQGHDGPGRAPTPRPQRFAQPDRRPSQAGMSTLRQESAYDLVDYMSPDPTMPPTAPQVDSGLYSAEDEQSGSHYASPTSDIPSSPPELPTRRDIIQPALNSPAPATQINPNDSGFGSDTVDIQDQRVRNKEQGKKKQLEAIHKRNSTTDWISHCYGPQELLPSKMHLTENFERAQKNLTSYQARLQSAAADLPPPASQSHRTQAPGVNQSDLPDERPMNPLPSENPIPSTPCPASKAPDRPILATSAPESNINVLPPFMLETSTVEVRRPGKGNTKPAKKSSKSNSQPRSRANSKAPLAAEQNGEAPGSTPAPEGPQEPPKPRSGSGARRKKMIQDNLESAIRSGEMPRFCINCGDIKPSTWRKAFTRVVDGDPADVVLRNEAGGILCTEVLERDEDDRVTKYRIYKKSPGPEDKVGDNIEEVTLCNSCGIYFVSKGAMRPSFLWGKRQKPGESKMSRQRKKKIEYTGLPQPSSDFFAPPQSDAGMSVDGTGENGSPDDALNTNAAPADQAERQPSTSKDDSAAAAPQDALQATPENARPEVQQNSAEIGVDPTPKPTRRLLFPSPRKDGEMKLLGEDPASSKASLAGSPPHSESGNGNSMGPSQTDAQGDGAQFTNEDASETPADQTNESTEADKENHPPPISDYELAHLFDDLPEIASPSAPKTPRKTPQSNKSNSTFSFASLLKTPTPATRRSIRIAEKSGGKDRSSRSRRQRDGDQDNEFSATPSRSSKRRRRRSLVEADDNALDGNDGLPPTNLGVHMTPFTAQLNQMLSDGLFTSPHRTFGLLSSPGRVWGAGQMDGGMQLDGADWTSDGFFEDAGLMQLQIPGDAAGLGMAGFVGQGNGKGIDQAGVMTDATVPSSPPALNESALGFEFYVDPDADEDWSVPREMGGLGLQDAVKPMQEVGVGGMQGSAVDVMEKTAG